MTDAELKLTLFRWIDQLSGDRLRMLFKFVGKKLDITVEESVSYEENLEAGYAEMAADTVRESEAVDWIEGANNHENL